MAPTPTNSIRWLLPVIALALVAGTLWLRAPTFGFKTWNVDEAIHAAVARTLLDGGVLYRDAVDQRTPLTYCVMTAIFAVAGENNFYAMHTGVALVIAATAWLLLLVARRMGGLASGLWTRDIGRAIKVSRAMESGTVWVNTYRAVSFMAPFGGYKRSGIGRESGQESIFEFLQTKSVWIETEESTANPFIIR